MVQNKDEEIVFFDKFVIKNIDYIGISSAGYNKLFSELSKSLGYQKQNIKIIDLGCGTGAFTEKLSLLSSNVYGCDISPESIKRAKHLFPNMNFSVQDIENLKFKDNFFDVIVFSGVLHHFIDLQLPLMEAKRILKPGGLIFAFDPNLHNPFFWLYRRKKSWLYSSQGVTKNEEPLTKKKIKFVMELCKFKKIEVYGIANISFKYIKNKKLLLPIYNLVDFFIDKIPYFKNVFGSFLIIKAKKNKF